MAPLGALVSCTPGEDVPASGQIVEAKAVRARRQVQAECLSYALGTRQDAHVWVAGPGTNGGHCGRGARLESASRCPGRLQSLLAWLRPAAARHCCRSRGGDPETGHDACLDRDELVFRPGHPGPQYRLVPGDLASIGQDACFADDDAPNICEPDGVDLGADQVRGRDELAGGERRLNPVSEALQVAGALRAAELDDLFAVLRSAWSWPGGAGRRRPVPVPRWRTSLRPAPAQDAGSTGP